MAVYNLVLSMLLWMMGFKGQWALADTAQASRVTLVAEITVENNTSAPLEGYLHRVAMPVQGHMQQRLIGVRQSGNEPLQRKAYRNGVGEYIELEWDIPAHTRSVRRIYFELLVHSYDFTRSGQPEVVAHKIDGNEDRDLAEFLKPSENIESDSKQIVRLARQIEHNYSEPEARLRAAFLTPQQLINYRRQTTKGALYAVTHREGDCSEYAALFVALARAMGFPARMTSEFLFTSEIEFSQPNHHAAEVYLNGQWIPVDANLALDPEFGYGFGVGGSKKLVLNRNSVWVWSNLWPRGTSERAGNVGADMHWRIEMNGDN